MRDCKRNIRNDQRIRLRTRDRRSVMQHHFQRNWNSRLKAQLRRANGVSDEDQVDTCIISITSDDCIVCSDCNN